MIAIALLVALLALGAWATLATVTAVVRDGYRREPTDWSRPGTR